MRASRRTRGQTRVSVSQLLSYALLVVLGYGVWKYGPPLKHRWDISDIARRTAAKMIREGNEMKLREELFAQVKAATGLEIAYLSDVTLERDETGRRTVTVKWKEQVRHVWGRTHVLEMQVTKTEEYVKMPGMDG